MTPPASTAEALLAERGALLPELVVEVVAAVADQLDSWAADGLVYGTVQPSEIDVLLDGDVLVAAAITGFPSPPETLSPTVLMAKARFLAPELLGGNVFGPGTDTYALACTAFELLSGRAPFAGRSVLEMMGRAARGAVLATCLPGDLGIVLATALAPDPRDRYETAGEFAAVLRRAIGIGPTGKGGCRETQ